MTRGFSGHARLKGQESQGWLAIVSWYPLQRLVKSGTLPSMQIERADNFIARLGVEAYRVGGSVRDELLGRRPKDADYMVRGVALRALAELVQDQGRDIRVSTIKDRKGQAFGVRASRKGLGLIEIALPRREENDGDGRSQRIVADPEITVREDAIRRDFTFNALYKPIAGDPTFTPCLIPSDRVIDPTGRGLHDLQRGLIQTTHANSFRDDPLRTLRALRFVARGFSITEETQRQMVRHASAVDGLTSNGYASGTVLDEMSKILMGDNVREALRIARDTGVLAALFPELVPMIGFEQESKYHNFTVDEHTFAALHTAAAVEAPLAVRWSLLFHDSGKPGSAWRGRDGRLHYYAQADYPFSEDHAVVGEAIWRRAARRINVPSRLRDDVSTLIRHHMVSFDGKMRPSKIRVARVRFGDDMLRDLYMHRMCDLSGKGKPSKAGLERIAQMEVVRREAQRDSVPCSAKDLQVNGRDAMDAGLSGKEIGNALNAILVDVAAAPSETTLSREWQLGRLVAQ